MTVFLLLISSLLTPALAQIQNEPVEVIVATPLSTFSERAGAWPTYEISQDELNGARTVTDVLNNVPGLQAREQGSPTISIRGSAQADRVLQLYDGVPLNFADGIGASNLFIPEESIGRLRLLKGPASVFYGPSAMAGALDHRTRIFERRALRLSATDDSGLLGTRSLFAASPFAVARRANDSQLTTFIEQKPGHYAYDSATGLGSGRRENNGTDTFRGTFSGDWKFGRLQVHPLFLLAQQSGDIPGALYFPYHSSFNIKGSLVSVESRFAASSDTEFGLRLSDARLWREDTDPSGANSSSNSRSSLAADWKKNLFDVATLRTFLDARTDSLNATYIGDSRLTETAFEAGQTYEIPLSAWLSLQPAYRYLPNYGEFVKAVGLHGAIDMWRGWLTYSEGFRNPSLSDRFANFVGYQANPGLRPEKSKGAELGARFEQGRRYGGFLEGYAIGATAHYTQYENLFDTAGAGAATFTKVNAGSAHTSGIELEAAYGVSVWTFSAAHSFLETKNETTGETLRLAPRHQTSFTVSNELGPAVIEMKETLWSTYYDKDTSNLTHELPGWATTDLTVRTLGLSDWEFRAGVLDLFNTPRDLTYGFPEAQRRFYASALRYF